MTDDKTSPPPGYSVYPMGEHRLHKGCEYWISRARLTSDGEHWTRDDAIAACHAHRNAIRAEALREAADKVEDGSAVTHDGFHVFRGDGRADAVDVAHWLLALADEIDPKGGRDAG